MILAFTGTQRGMTMRQRRIVEALLVGLAPSSVRHGGCIGSDEEFHELCLLMGITKIEVWPSNVVGKVSRLTTNVVITTSTIIIHKPKPPLLRNLDIVAGADHLIACPDNAEETLRSGTWATVRLSTRYNIPCTVIKPTDEPTLDERR